MSGKAYVRWCKHLISQIQQSLLQIVGMNRLTCVDTSKKVIRKSYLIRVKDTRSNGNLKGFRLHSNGTFDTEWPFDYFKLVDIIQ